MNELRVDNLNVGDRIRHPAFSEGLVTKCELGVSGVVVTIAFDHTHGIKRFLLSKTPMIMVEKYIAPPKIIKERKSPHTYTSEFKIKVVKQALISGRAVVRKHYKIPETTLRSWIKQFDIEEREN